MYDFYIRILTHLCRVDSFTLDKFISYIRGVWRVFIIVMFYRNILTKWKRVDPDQTPRFAASDLGLYCLSMSF